MYRFLIEVEPKLDQKLAETTLDIVGAMCELKDYSISLQQVRDEDN